MYLVLLTDKSLYYDRADLSTLPQSNQITIIIIIITILKPRVVGPDDGVPAKHRPVNQAEWDLRGEGGIIKSFSVNIGVDADIGVDLGVGALVDIGVDVWSANR